MRILIVDDESIVRRLLRAMLESDHHQVFEAEDGELGLDLWRKERPDIVLMDIRMPHLDGFSATRKIKEESGEVFTPILFLTGDSTENAIELCIAAGGDDFIPKPFSRTVLRAKLEATRRVLDLHLNLIHQRDVLARHERHLLHERAIAAAMFERIVGQVTAPNLETRVSPVALFNGDLVLADTLPSGGQRILVGDFTGHGFGAAIGALPVAEVFRAMTSKELAVPLMLVELDRKLGELLPTGLFLAAAVAETTEQGLTTVWNLGLPEVLQVRIGYGIIRRIPSSTPPLGIKLKVRPFVTEQFELGPEDALILCTDGLIETRNPEGLLFGSERLDQILNHLNPNERIADIVQNATDQFRGASNQDDDITLVVLRNIIQPVKPTTKLEKTSFDQRFILGASDLRANNPIQRILTFIATRAELTAQSTHINLILSELVTNALDYGVLALSPQLKSHPATYGEYHAERLNRLATLTDASITVTLRYRPEPAEEYLEISVEDPGQGFSLEQLSPALSDNHSPSGRGLALIKALCGQITQAEPHHTITVRLHLQDQPD